MSLNKISNSKEFIINRASRLYPTYWASVTITFFLKSLWSIFMNKSVEYIPWVIYLGNMTMFQFNLNLPNLDDPYWTMTIELIFYLGILILYQLDLLVHLNIVGFVLTLSAIVLSFLIKYYNWAENILIWIPLLKYIPLFWVGTVFYKLSSNQKDYFKQYALVIICFASQILISEKTGRSNFFISTPEYILMLFMFFCVFILFINKKLSFIINRTNLFFGKISFALYLTHQYILLSLLVPILEKVLKINYLIVSFGIAFPIGIIIACIITYYVEIPFSKKMKECLNRIRCIEN